MDPNQYGMTGAPEATPEPVALSDPTRIEGVPTLPEPADRMVTLPSPGTPEQQVHKVTADEQVHELTYDELLRAASGGLHFESQMEKLKPYKEMREFVETTPGAADALAYLLTQGMTPQQAMQEIAPQQQGFQAPQQQYPQQPQYQQQPAQQDPAVGFLMQQVAGMQYQQDIAAFQAEFPEANLKEVEDFVTSKGLPPSAESLSIAYKAMNYGTVNKAAAIAQQQNTLQRQRTAVETGAEGAPTTLRVNPHTLTPDQRTQIAVDHYNLIE